jgi:hypothetical protein
MPTHTGLCNRLSKIIHVNIMNVCKKRTFVSLKNDGTRNCMGVCILQELRYLSNPVDLLDIVYPQTVPRTHLLFSPSISLVSCSLALRRSLTWPLFPNTRFPSNYMEINKDSNKYNKYKQKWQNWEAISLSITQNIPAYLGNKEDIKF